MNKILILSIVLIVFVTMLPNSFAEKIVYKNTSPRYVIIIDDAMKMTQESAFPADVFSDDKSSITIRYGPLQRYYGSTEEPGLSSEKLNEYAKTECILLAPSDNTNCQVDSVKGEMITVDNKKSFQATYTFTLTDSKGIKTKNNLVSYVYIQDHDAWEIRISINGEYTGGSYEKSVFDSVYSFQSMEVFERLSNRCIDYKREYKDIINQINDETKSKFGNTVSQDVADFVSTSVIAQKRGEVIKAVYFLTKNCNISYNGLKHLADYNQNISDSIDVYRMKVYDQVLMNNPNDKNALYDKAALLAVSGNADEAIPLYDKYLQFDSDWLVWVAKGYSLFAIGNYDDALNAFDHASEINPNANIGEMRNSIIKEKKMFEEINKKKELYYATDPGNNSLLGLVSLIENSKTINKSQIVSSKVPDWIKNNAKWWADGTINDSDFVKGVEYLIKNQILNISSNEIKCNQPSAEDGDCVSDAYDECPLEPETYNGFQDDDGCPDKAPTEIPSWIKNNAKWWADGQITENDFLKGIEFLANNGIIKVN